ncbi:hypothetical protein BDY21DRAFT_330690 [Lineolata rhizophorae]|uniref:Uncharacterized protein n=1 Tax=Lineolata rhizophorae TaxID=578093 RepID=A0A6A6PEJ7_9PEZI|nr:hypothetical protein BDY21DRAFT_330690 [Lineolata rhizophorae]
MGHSTGCQDTMQYLVGGSGGAKAGDAGESGVDGAMVDQGEREGTSADRGRRPKLDGAILQAPVSDREAMVEMLGGDDFSRMVREVQEQWIDAGRSDDVLPASYAGKLFGKSSAVTAYRWMSLASPDGTGDDDYFSSDLPEQQLQRTFGRLGRVAPETPVMLLYGERDQYVPGWVDKEALVRKWAGIIKQGGAALDDTNGGIVPGASHNLRGDPEHVLRDLFSRVNGFLQRIDKGDIKTAPHL